MLQRIFCLYACLLFFLSLSAQQLIVDASQQDTTIRFMQGFLHGGPQFVDSALTAELRPAFWRIGAYDGAGGSYDDVARFHPKITLVINDYYMIVNGISSQTQSQPWINSWQAWDQVVEDLALASIANNKPVDYWNVWGEPDNFWTGSYADWIEMYRRTDSILHSHLPNAKITGPEFGFATCNFSVSTILQFLDSLHAVGSSVDGVSWHEFCDPASVPIHVSLLRDSLQNRLWANNLEIHIPEYSGPSHHTIPGWNAGWLYYLEKAQVDWVSRACWDESDGVLTWSDCQYGLNGLFMADGSSPQPGYWVHRAYAELDSVRLITYSSYEKNIALASRNDATEELTIIASHFSNPVAGQHDAPANVSLTIRHYPFCQNCSVPVIIQRIPSNNVAHSIPLTSPETSFNGTLYFTGDSTIMSLSNFTDGDVYVIHFNPTDSSLLELPIKQQYNSQQLLIVPNPASTEASLLLPDHIQVLSVTVFSIDGQSVLHYFPHENELTKISTVDLPAGSYFITVKTGEGSEFTSIFQHY